MKHKATRKHLLAKHLLATVITLGLAQPALAVTDEEFKTLQEQFNLLADQVEENSQNSTSNTTVGGYGELHYNNLSNGAGTDKKVLDLHRFVLFFNHEFNDDIRFFSEFEIEHAIAGDGQVGEVEVEQAYVQFDIGEGSNIDAGVFLIPVGILNETHEPPTFYGVERNPIEKYIIPATWWEGGAMFSSRFDSGISYDVALTSGLDGGTDIRGGRQKTGKANASTLALTGRVKYTGMRGLEVAGTVSLQDDMTQGYIEDPSNPDPALDNVEGATLVEAHAPMVRAHQLQRKTNRTVVTWKPLIRSHRNGGYLFDRTSGTTVVPVIQRKHNLISALTSGHMKMLSSKQTTRHRTMLPVTLTALTWA